MYSRRLSQRQMINVFILTGLSLVFLIAGVAPGAAQDYPSRPITINVGFPPGSGAGNGAQIFANYARKYLPKPQPILINFKPGAASAVAADYVVKQPADGYNLLWVLPDLITKLVKDGHQLSFKKEDFSFIGTLGISPCLVTVRMDSPFKKLEDLIDYAKKNPDKVTYGSAGIASGNHLTAEILQMRCGIKLNHVPFAGGAQGITALLGGHIDCFIGGSVAALGTHILPGGGLRVLTVFAQQRWPELPDAPTCKEKGYDIQRTVWFTLAVPKGTPREIVDVWLEVFKKTMDDPEVKSALTKMGYKAVNFGPEETKKEIDEEFDVAREVFKKLGMIQ
ncbi:MAG: tripartite tricarboxylate transporter substrate binding protein [Deltaproteobacteria bacterium]